VAANDVCTISTSMGTIYLRNLTAEYEDYEFS
jgi:hypothetical protein